VLPLRYPIQEIDLIPCRFFVNQGFVREGQEVLFLRFQPGVILKPGVALRSNSRIHQVVKLPGDISTMPVCLRKSRRTTYFACRTAPERSARGRSGFPEAAKKSSASKTVINSLRSSQTQISALRRDRDAAATNPQLGANSAMPLSSRS